MPFKEVKPGVKFPEMEKEVLRFWKDEDIFEKSREIRKGKERFVFLEGPPTANGKPHIGHALTRAIKDAFLRYELMNGKDVQPYFAGWDCHGLPVEIEVEKRIGAKNKADIEAYGVREFNKLCKESVFRYKDLWEGMTERIGFWIDFENAYVTMKDSYIESVWWSLSKAWKKGLLFKDYKVVPYCPRCGTPLSSHEVAQGYRETKDPSVFVKFKVRDEDAYFLVWTTTPWTLISNVLIAVGKDLDYVLVEHEGERLYLAKGRLHVLKGDYKVIKEMKGSELIGKRYEQLFTYVKPDTDSHFVVHADFVSLEDGSGMVHIAPAFGIDDYELCRANGVGMVNPVGEDGKFTDAVPPYAGRFVKDCDKDIMIELEKRGHLYAHGKITHTYPFCWRCDSPLLYYALDTWFIRMSALREEMIANNEQVNWKPEHLKHGRFGNFLNELKDWALSRNRYWGTPLPVWTCENGHQIAVSSKAELEKYAGKLPDDFELHRPWVDEVEIKCPECGKPMKREPYTIDVWYDSGSAPFAQYHYPFENKEEFESSFPVHFITEALDQTRGWFYTLLAVSTLTFDRPAYKNVLTLGLILDEDGEKMSKSKGNAISPDEMMEKYGADAVRFYFYTSPVWYSKRFGFELVKDVMSKSITTLWNVYSFFVTNANLDDFSPSGAEVTDELDRWLLSRLNSLIKEVRDGFDTYEIHRSGRAVMAFIDDLSNWYLRRSRRRFWEGTPEDKKGAYEALYTALVTLSKLMSPLTPFLAETMYQNLVRSVDPEAPESVNMCDYPLADRGLIDEELEKDMALVIKAVEAGRSARQGANIKLRMPLSEAIISGPDSDLNRLERFTDVIKEELNVKQVVLSSGEGMMEASISPNYGVLGPKFRARMKDAVKAIEALTPGDVEALRRGEVLNIDGLEISQEDVIIVDKVKEGYSGGHAEGTSLSVLVNTEITDELRYEGLAREIIRRIQNMRKDMDLEYDAHIETYYSGDSELEKAIETHKEYIMKETLSDVLEKGEKSGTVWKIEGMNIELAIKRV